MRYFLMIQDSLDDNERPFLQGPFDTADDARGEAKEYVVQDGQIFTILSQNSEGEINQEDQASADVTFLQWSV